MGDGEPLNTIVEGMRDDLDDEMELPAERLDDDFDIATARDQIHRAQLGELRTVRPDKGSDLDAHSPSTNEAGDALSVEPDTPTSTDFRFDPDEWATDLGRVIERTTGGKLVFEFEQLRHIAGDLLGHSFGSWVSEAAKLQLTQHRDDDAYVPNFTVERWADDLNEAILRETHGSVSLDRIDLHVAANLLLHAQEDEWIPQASRLRQEHESARVGLKDSTAS
jgi:hypothetical protein